MEGQEDLDIFGSSPYTLSEKNIITNSKLGGKSDGKLGGNIDFKNNYYTYLLWAVIIIIILYVIYTYWLPKKDGLNTAIDDNQQESTLGAGNTQYSTEHSFNKQESEQLVNYYNKISGDTFDYNAEKALEHGEKIHNPSAVEHFRMGSIYLLNQKNHEKAHEHFKAALNQVIEGKVDIKEVPYVVNRIDDFKDHFIDYPEIDDLPMQEALLAFYNRQRDEIKAVENKGARAGLVNNPGGIAVIGGTAGPINTGISDAKIEISPDDPDYKQKVLLSKQEWISDSQNVHDSAMYQILKEQYELVNNENFKIKNIQLHDYNEVVNWLKHRFRDDNDKLAKLHVYLNTLNNNYPIGLIPGVKEQDIITAVWRRSFDPENKDKDIKEALADSVLDCIERGSLVCMSGRTKKIWQSLAYNDKNETIGIFKSKQAIRNEIFQKCAKIINDYVGSDGTVSEQLKTAYINDENTEQVNELKATIKKQMDNIIGDYKDLLPDEQLRLIIDECKVNV